MSERPGLPESVVGLRFQRVLEAMVLLLMLALAGVVVVGVGFRKLGASLVWYDEVASILLAWLTYYGAALAAYHRAHIGMPTVMAKLSAPWRAPLFVFAEVVVLSFFVILAWTGWQVQAALSGTTLVSLPSVPAALAQSVIPIGAVLFIVGQLLSIPRAWATYDVKDQGASSEESMS